MGVIKRQGGKTLVVNFLGAVIGALAVLFVYSSNDSIYGYAHWLFSAATLLLPLASLGVLSLVIRFFPEYQQSDSKGYNGFLTLISLLLLGAFLIFLFIWKWLTPQFYKLLKNEDMNYQIFKSYEIYLLILVALFVILKFLGNHSANKLRVVVPNIIREFGYKLFLPLMILLYAHLGLNIHQFSWGIILFFTAASVLTLIYVIRLGGFTFTSIKKPSKSFTYKSLMSFSIFGILNQIGTGVAMRIDSVMIPVILGSTDFNSYYIKAFFMANFVEMPSRSLNQIANPIISRAWKNNDLVELRTIYKKASANLLLVGVYVFLGIWFCLDDLVSISADPDSFPYVKEIFLLIGLSKLIDMITSVNTYIIGYSSFYKYNLLFILLLAVFNFVLNLELISEHGIAGAALASALSILVYNIIKLIFIWHKFKMLPFTWSNLKTLILGSAIFALYFIIEFEFHAIINILLKGTLVSILFLPIAYYWKISEDINETVQNYIKKLKNWNGV